MDYQARIAIGVGLVAVLTAPLLGMAVAMIGK